MTVSIMLDARPCRGVTGIGRYARSVVQAIVEDDPTRRCSVLSWRRDAAELRTIVRQARVVSAFPGRLFSALERSAMPIPLPGSYGVFHGTSYSVPNFVGMRSIGTFYDIAYRHFPSAYPPGVADGFDRSVRRALTHVDRVVTLSHHAKEELLGAYPLDPDRVVVVYPAVSIESLTPATEPIPDEASNSLLFVGEIGHRKNVLNLVRAFATVASSISHTLVLAGPDGASKSYSEAVRSEIRRLGIAGRVRMPGWLPEAELAQAYRHATALLLPSLYEGFGYPLIDAMAIGKPIVTSNVSSMPEIAAGAALLVDPLDVEEIGGAMVAVVHDDALRRRLSENGRRRAALFTTQAMVDRFSRLYRDLTSSN